MNISQPVDTKDILNKADKETYDKARELIAEIKCGPLVSMYEKQDSRFQNQVNTYRKTKRKTAEDKRTEFIKILDYLHDNITNHSGIKSIDSKQKQEKGFQDSLKVGQRVVTTSGLHGRIAQVQEDGIVIETLSGKLKFEKAAISREFTQQRFPDSADDKK